MLAADVQPGFTVTEKMALKMGAYIRMGVGSAPATVRLSNLQYYTSDVAIDKCHLSPVQKVNFTAPLANRITY